MTIVLFIAIMIIDFIFFLIHKKSVVLTISNIFIFSLIYAGNIREDISDIFKYKMQYISQTSSFSEPGYLFITDIFSNLGVPFNGFLLIVYIFFIVSILILTYKLHCNFAFLFFSFDLFYFFFSLEVLRSFIAFSFLLIGIFFLLRNQKCLYVIFVLISTSVHFSMILFMILVIVNSNMIKDKAYKILACVCIGMCAVTILNDNRIPFVAAIFNVISDSFLGAKNSEFYNGTITAEHGWMYSSLYYLFNFSLLYAAKKLLKNIKSCQTSQLEILKKLYNISFRANCLMGMIMPFAMMSPTYLRYIYFVSWMILILLAGIIGEGYDAKWNGSMLRIPSNSVTTNCFLVIFLTMMAWTACWWYVNPNAADMFYALSQNMFY